MNKCIKTLIILAYNIDKITFKFGIIAVVDFKFSIQTYLSPKEFSRDNGFMTNFGMVLFYTYFFDWIFLCFFHCMENILAYRAQRYGQQAWSQHFECITEFLNQFGDRTA